MLIYIDWIHILKIESTFFCPVMTHPSSFVYHPDALQNEIAASEDNTSRDKNTVNFSLLYEFMCCKWNCALHCWLLQWFFECRSSKDAHHWQINLSGVGEERTRCENPFPPTLRYTVLPAGSREMQRTLRLISRQYIWGLCQRFEISRVIHRLKGLVE